jgi:hypothetical protein
VIEEDRSVVSCYLVRKGGGIVVRAGMSMNELELQANLETLLMAGGDLMNMLGDKPHQWQIEISETYEMQCRATLHDQTLVMIMKQHQTCADQYDCIFEMWEQVLRLSYITAVPT